MQVVVGRVGRPHGVRGELSIELRTDEPERRFAPGTSLQFDGDDGSGMVTIASTRPHAGRLLVQFEQVVDRTGAERLRGATLSTEVGVDERPEDPEEFYDHQLVGLEVRTPDGESVGTVAAVLHLPGQDALSIRTERQDEVLVPFVSELVPDVDVGQRHLVVRDVPGLLDPDAAETTRE